VDATIAVKVLVPHPCWGGVLPLSVQVGSVNTIVSFTASALEHWNCSSTALGAPVEGLAITNDVLEKAPATSRILAAEFAEVVSGGGGAGGGGAALCRRLSPSVAERLFVDPIHTRTFGITAAAAPEADEAASEIVFGPWPPRPSHHMWACCTGPSGSCNEVPIHCRSFVQPPPGAMPMRYVCNLLSGGVSDVRRNQPVCTWALAVGSLPPQLGS